jgi:hypothetical protein
VGGRPKKSVTELAFRRMKAKRRLRQRIMGGGTGGEEQGAAEIVGGLVGLGAHAVPAAFADDALECRGAP